MYGGPSPETTGPSPGPSPEGRGVVCEVTPIGLLAWVVMCFFSYAGEVYLLRWGVLSLTELTDLTDPFCAQFRTHKIVAPPPTPPPQGGA